MTTTTGAATRVAYPLAYRNLAAIALIGDAFGVCEDSATVSTAVEATLADPTQFRIFRAIAQGVAGDSERANATLAADLEASPDADAVRVGIAVAMMFAGDSGWRAVVDQVMATSEDQRAREAAMAVIDYVKTMPSTH